MLNLSSNFVILSFHKKATQRVAWQNPRILWQNALNLWILLCSMVLASTLLLKQNTHPQTPSAREGALLSLTPKPQVRGLSKANPPQGRGAFSRCLKREFYGFSLSCESLKWQVCVINSTPFKKLKNLFSKTSQF